MTLCKCNPKVAVVIAGIAFLACSSKNGTQKSGVDGRGGSRNASTSVGGATHVDTATGGFAGTSDATESSGGFVAEGAQGQSNIGSSGTAGAASTALIAPGISIKDCGELGSRVCERLSTCAPFYLERYYGTLTVCQSLYSRMCDAFAASGIGIDKNACAASLDDCGAFVQARHVPEYCRRPPGAAVLGASCTSDKDCAQGLCNSDKGVGVCATPAVVGADCTPPVRCSLGLLCNPSTLKCHKPRRLAESCANALDCELGLRCGADGFCRKSELAEACTSSIAPCSTGNGQECFDDVCVGIGWLSTEQSCQVATSVCKWPDNCAVVRSQPLSQSARCLGAVDLGSPCGASAPCLSPLVCTAGVCATD